MSYAILKDLIYDLLVNQKNLPFSELYNLHFSLPVERISKLLDMLKDEINASQDSQLKKFFIKEIQFARVV